MGSHVLTRGGSSRAPTALGGLLALVALLAGGCIQDAARPGAPDLDFCGAVHRESPRLGADLLGRQLTKPVHTVIIGCDTIEHVEDNVQIGPLPHVPERPAPNMVTNL